MKFRNSSIIAAAAMLFTSIVPVHAAPLQLIDRAPLTATVPSDITEQVQYRRDRDYRRPPPRRHGYYNGHRGYRDYRPGYRRHNGYWFPLAAFATGALIGGAMNNQAAPRYGGSHNEWCSNRWRSYRAYDNSYQPNNGPRKQCVSPFMR